MFHGSMVALATPFTTEDTLDLDALARLVEFHIDNGTSALVIAGTTGEAATLSFDEKKQLISKASELVNGRIPLIAGSAAQGTKQTVELSIMAKEQGVDAVLIMTPAYIKPTQEGIFLHYQQVASQCPLPIILYNVPSRTACQISVDTVVRLAQISNIVGIKEASGQPSISEEIIARCGDRIDVYSGDDDKTLGLMKLGAKGVVSVTANVAPKQMSEMCQYALDGELSKAEALNQKLTPLHQALFLESNPIPCKWAMAHLGLINNEIRSPLTRLSDRHYSALEKALAVI